jgi:hypothetical protein
MVSLFTTGEKLESYTRSQLFQLITETLTGWSESTLVDYLAAPFEIWAARFTTSAATARFLASMRMWL